MLDPANLNNRCEKCTLYIKSIYEPICFYPQELIVSYNLDNKDFITFTIECNERDDGVIIGRQGKTIQAIRLFTHAFSKTHLEGNPCIVQIKDHRNSRYNPFLTSKRIPNI